MRNGGSFTIYLKMLCCFIQQRCLNRLMKQYQQFSGPNTTMTAQNGIVRKERQKRPIKILMLPLPKKIKL